MCQDKNRKIKKRDKMRRKDRAMKDKNIRTMGRCTEAGNVTAGLQSL